MSLGTDPNKVVSKINSDANMKDEGMMAPIVGGQRVSMYPYKGVNYDKPDYLAKIQDRWDFGLDTGEKEKLMEYLKRRYLKGDHNFHLKTPSTYTTAPGQVDGQQIDPAQQDQD